MSWEIHNYFYLRKENPHPERNRIFNENQTEKNNQKNLKNFHEIDSDKIGSYQKQHETEDCA